MKLLIFTSTFNVFGQTTNTRSLKAHHSLPATNIMTDIGSVYASLFNSTFS